MGRFGFWSRRCRYVNRVNSGLWNSPLNTSEFNLSIVCSIDGAAKGCPGAAAVGAIARNHDGHAVAAIAYEIGTADALLAEATALVEGCKLALALNSDKVFIESDSNLVVDAFLNNASEPWRIAHLLHEARAISSLFVEFKIEKIYREANGPADGLANFAISRYSCFWKSNLPSSIFNLVIFDLIGGGLVRSIPG